MQSSVFRAYDIRGIVGSELIIGNVYNLMKSFLYYCKQNNIAFTKVFVCMDGRFHSKSILDEVILAFSNCEIEVFDGEICPTPVAYFVQIQDEILVSIVVTASHNSLEYNGLKIIINGEPLSANQLQELKKHYEESMFEKESENRAKIINYSEIKNNYCDMLLSKFPELINCKIPFIIDCAGGAVASLINELCVKFNFQNLKKICCQIDSQFSKHDPDPTKIENIKDIIDEILIFNAQCGFGFDGDGDRVVAIDENGINVQGDKLIALFVEDIAKRNLNASFVVDYKCSLVIDEILKQYNSKIYRVSSGHNIIKAEMKNKKALFAGEFSGHYCSVDNYFGFDDGIYSMLSLLSILEKNEKTLSKIVSDLPTFYNTSELRIACESKDSIIILEKLHEKYNDNVVSGFNRKNTCYVILSDGWFVARTSNTEPLISIRAEGMTQKSLSDIVNVIVDIISNYVDREKLYLWSKDIRK